MVAMGNVIPPAAAIISAPLLARSLGVEGRGLVAAATAPLFLAMFISTCGLPDAATYFIARDPARARKYGRLAAMLMIGPAIAATLICIALTPILSAGDHTLAKLMVISSCALPVVLGVTMLRAIASAKRRWRSVANEQIISALIRIVLIVGFFGLGHLTRLEATLITASAPYIGALAYLRRPTSDVPTASAPVDTVNPRTLMSFGVKVWIGAISGVLLLRLDQTVMTPLSNARQLGLYAVAANFAEVALIVNNAFRDVSFVSQASQYSAARAAGSARVAGGASAVLGVLIGLAVPVLIPLGFGSAFDAAEPVTIVLIAAVVLGTPGSVAGATLTGRGQPSRRSLSLAIGCVANIILLFPLAHLYGAIGAAWATLVGNIVASNCNIFFLCKGGEARFIDFYGIRRGDLSALRSSKISETPIPDELVGLTSTDEAHE